VWCPSYGLLKIKENASTQYVAHLKVAYMTYWKIPGHKNHPISILYLLLQVIDVIDFCAINSKIYISLES
jgi:hypothetical protein